MLVTHHRRFTFLRFLLLLGIFGITFRLGYWQIIKKDSLQAVAQEQYQRKTSQAGQRGNIYSSDGYLLVGNQPVYRLFAEPHLLTLPPLQLASLLAPVVATDPATVAVIQASISARLSNTDSRWVALLPKISAEAKENIETLSLKGLGFDQYSQRWYPEASLAAHTLGFVGKNNNGEDLGYFGVEGALEKELSPKSRQNILEKDALGYHLLGSTLSLQELDGRDITLTIRRDLQSIVEKHLKKGMEKYQPKAAEVIIMEPTTGKILASAAYPNYDPSLFYTFPPEYYKHPSFSAGYEPGSTLKTLTVAAGIDSGKITPETKCPICHSAREISGYTIKTWNNQYHPDITMTEALAKSDNTAMMYITDLLGRDQFVQYLQGFGLGTKSYAEVQEDTSPPFPTKWGPVELATGSFGQGISVTSIQLLKAVNAIANQGKIVRPQLVEFVYDPVTGQKITTEPVIEKQAITPETAATVTKMMVNAAEAGEAQWIAAKTTHTVAAKTGTSQVAENGAYNPEKTIATFIGFAPAQKPQFIMLVKLVEPQSSIWAAETAAPLWYQIANDLYRLLQIPPDKTEQLSTSSSSQV